MLPKNIDKGKLPGNFFNSYSNFLQFEDTVYQKMELLKGQSHEKVGEMSVWGISLGPN
jgi:hypothetical protein